ncbi:unnamed protein product [Kluyveromyces dobzhanskii CBS 2104]|uniref:WGS project CCBQ000000000 data, contig 00043 n=1 Tax=Kluyveromyces dobzhanskii CBS 2104 TaxID=1427455 RepID=A0A0A8L2M9_9SACH|nr:unnamed protein product [Kluyveromyces dobzhanskii CBS 2104]
METSSTIQDVTLVEFWEKLEGLLEVNVRNESEVNSALVSFVKITADNYHSLIKCDQDLYRIGLMLVESPMFEYTTNFCLRKLLSLLSIDLLELNLKLIIAYIILYKCKIDLHALDIILENQGFQVLYNNIYSNFAYLNKYGDEHLGVVNPEREFGGNGPSYSRKEADVEIIGTIKHLTTILIDVMYQFFKYSKCQIANIQLIDDFFIYYLVSSIRSDVIDDIMNNVKFKLLLALNEQYMILEYEYDIENKAYEFLINHNMSKDFIGLLLLKFNRETDTSLLIMMCKAIYIILTKDLKVAKDFFYLNDLHVFVDVLLRNLNNISDNEEILRHTYLRVLTPLLNNTELATTEYHKSQISATLRYFSNVDNFSSTENAAPQQKTTSRLASKCLRDVQWLDCDNQNLYDQNDSEESRRSSISVKSPSDTPLDPTLANAAPHLYRNLQNSYSADSINHKSNQQIPPPPPPSRKLQHRQGSDRKLATAKLGALR